MDKPIIERDVVLIGKDEDGNDTFDFPVTRLGNIENDAEIKEKPGAGDYFPVIDMSDNGKMKKTSTSRIFSSLNSHVEDDVKHITAEERSLWNGKADGSHTHDDRYYTETEIDGKLAKKSDNGHTHSVSEVTGMPSSLPAKGGDADTVDGKHAAEFAAASHSHSAATQSTGGFMSAADKKKLDGIAASANNYSHPAYTARTGVPTANQTPAFGGTFSVSQPVSDASGHITNMNSRTVKIPDTVASSSEPGLMSAEDKRKLDKLKGISGVQSVTLGSSYIYPTYTVPEGAQYYIMLFRFGTRCIFAGFYSVDVQADINTGDVGFRLYEPENAGPNYSSTDYIRVQREGDTLRIGAYQTVDGVTDAKMKGGVTIQMIFF